MNAFEPVQWVLRLGFNLIAIGLPIALGVALAFRIARPALPRARYLVALVAFAAAACLPLAATLLPRQEPRRTAAGPSSPATHPGEVIDLAESSRAGRFAAAGWAGVAALLLAREALGHLALARARRRWRPAPAALRRSLGWPEGVALYLDSRDGPFAAGVRTRAVVLPEPLLAGCEARTVAALARHELDHARWRDPLATALLRIVRCALWVSPALWLLERIVRAESEAAADRRAVESLAPVDFASALVAVVRWRQSRRGSAGLDLVASSAAHPGMLEQRVRRLFEPGEPLSGARRAGACAAALAGLAICALLPLAPPPPDLAVEAAARRQTIEERLHGEPARQAADAVDALIARLPGRDWRAKDVAAELERLRSDGGVEAVIATLGDPSGRVREKMAWTLGELGDPRGFDPLTAALGDPSGPVRQTAAWALERLRKPHRAKLRAG
ncbi:MAG TPA: HEAT repeat domain-containing protein [Thermoanaerobaculia bacterium]|nr:HEAT repeat domain-containing protein [Thermoanaerobaculia bacterium]